MFQEVCLACGKLLDGDGQTYCSKECSTSDVVSPSISSASSACSSPHLTYATGGEVPALVPSALGTALHHAKHRYSTSSSSASSISWSLLTDEEDDLAEDEHAHNYRGASDYEGPGLLLKAPGVSSALSYARRPSATNHHSTVPLLHRRTSSSSSSGLASHGSGVPRSAPSLRFTEDDCIGSDAHEHDQYLSEREQETVSPKTKRTRNRASLPGYFSLLQISSPQRPPASSASSYSSSSAVGSHASPPTPKLGFSSGPVSRASKVKAFMSVSGTSSTTVAPPRGRQREVVPAQSDHRSSVSRSRSRHASRPPPQSSDVPPAPRGRMDSRSSIEKVFDWSNAPLTRGRTTVRRNSSPLAKMKESFVAGSDAPVVAGADAHSRRGRIAVSELDGYVPEAPGFGNGRSGLVRREREGVVGRVVGALR